ncbi:hypothetical protein LQZ24_05740 [Fructobacillus sp. M1-13]|uniref:DUF1642 domain-containing protein n=1 Tax=Fructobacillus papyriferae TaxID=2713171 RepID=A0ABS5QQ20_9LACO|nr:hypothetical protein [Fructobacillus papyriferae]MBS9335017.1 hypothetical protein [Fructobacillus papyriferae]MCD2159497.1 hypothetical protein [Fructobacillus papyriferae]
MVFENKKYGIRSMNGPLSDEAAKMIAKLMAKMVADHFEEKEDEKMTKKFTEEEYQKIVDIADGNINYLDLINTTALTQVYELVQESSTLKEYKKFKEPRQELTLIALPKSREWAHDQFVEKEKKYRWRSKKKDNDDDPVYITIDDYGVVTLKSICNTKIFPAAVVTESEIRGWGYTPEMFDREEVE